MKIQSVFDHMNRKKIHLALVKDENGLVVGIITLEDIIEEIVGDIADEHDVEEHHLTDEDDFNLKEGILIEGSISLRDLYNDFDIKIPLNDNFSTLAGFLLDMLGNRFPEKGQDIIWEGLSFNLQEVEDFEIKEVFIRDLGGEKHFFDKSETE
jgi:CBS domain containing-hemolysin-like protein